MRLRPSVRTLGTPLASAAVLGFTLAVTVGPSGSAAPAPPAGNASTDVSSTGGAGGPGQTRTALLPSMTPLRADDVYVTGAGGSRRLRFETSLANIGRGPMEVRPNAQLPCPGTQRGASQIVYQDADGSGHFRRDVDTGFKRRKAGCMVFHPTHNHWHFEASSFYSLRPVAPTPPSVSAYRKTSFCLRDSERVPESLGTFNHPLYYGNCSRNRPMGINIGWTDVYQSFLDGQSLDLGPRSKVPNGRYCLSIRVDPKDRLKESDETDNVSLRALWIRGNSVTELRDGVCA